MSTPPKARDNGKDNSGLSADFNNDGKVDLSEAIKRMMEVNSTTDVLRDDITKTGKDIAKIAKGFQEYISTRKNENTKSDDDSPVKTNKICKVYGCIYKGTYEGIIDGLKKVEDDKRTAKLEKDRVDAQKQFIKSTAKNIIGFPNTFRKGLINLFAFEKSEILQTYRAIRHSVGIDDKGNVDYAQRAFRLMLEDKSKKHRDVSPQAIGMKQIDILDRIAVALGAGEELTDRFTRKNAETQVDLLRDIRKGVGAQRRTFLQVQGITWKRTMTQSAYQTQLLQGINEKLKKQSGGFFGMFKKTESQTEVLSDIRESLSPRKNKPGFWTKPRYIFKRDTQRVDASERTIAGLAELLDETKYQTDGLGAIYNILHGGIRVQSIASSKLTPFEADSLKGLDDIEDANIAEIDAIASLPKTICECLRVGKADDYNIQKMVEGGIGMGEVEAENLANVASIKKSAEGIYSIMLKQSNGPDIPADDTSLMDTAKGFLQTAGDFSEVVQGTKSIKDLFAGNKGDETVSLSDNTMNKFEKMFDDIDDDGIFDSIKKRKKGGKRRGNVLEGNFPERPKKVKPPKPKGVIQKGKDIVSKGKNIAVKGVQKGKGFLGGVKDIALKGGSLIASTVPVMTGGMGMGGILTASGSTIAGAGAGALAGAAGLATAAGAAGYGIGTLLNKGINAGMSKMTDGKTQSLGGWFYDITHKKEIAEQKAQEEKLKKLMDENKAKKAKSDEDFVEAKAEMLRNSREDIPKPIPKTSSPFFSTGSMNINDIFDDKINTALGGSAAFIKSGGKVSPEMLNNLKEKLKEQGDLTPERIEKIKKMGSGINMSAVLGIGASTASLAKGIAGEIVSKAQGLEVSRTLTAIYDKSESARVELMSEMKDALDMVKSATSGSQTAKAIGETISDVTNTVTGATTNISVPVSPHDVDRGTNLLNNVYSG